MTNFATGILRVQESAAILGEWTAAGHTASSEWLFWVVRIAAWSGVALLLSLVARAIVRRHRYRAMDILSQEDCNAVSRKIHDAEKTTTGEIVAVVLERSDRHPGAEWLAAMSTLLLGSAVFAGYLPWDTPMYLLPCQVALGGLGFLLARVLPDFKRLFISEQRASEMTGEQALQEFFVQGLYKTDAATGVLIFVSLLEHRVVILADEGINGKVDSTYWEETDAAILDGIRAGSLHKGIEDGIARCGEVLAEHFPWQEGDKDELPNHLIVRQE